MKLPSKKLIFRLNVAGAVFACAAVAVALILPRVRHGEPVPEGSTKVQAVTQREAPQDPMRPILVQVDADAGPLGSSEMPSALTQSSEPELAPPEASRYRSDQPSRWQGAGASGDQAAVTSDRRQMPSPSDPTPPFSEPSQHNLDRSLDDAPLADVTQTLASAQPYADDPNPNVVAAVAQDDQFAANQPPPLVDAPETDQTLREPARMELGDDGFSNGSAVRPLEPPAAGSDAPRIGNTNQVRDDPDSIDLTGASPLPADGTDVPAATLDSGGQQDAAPSSQTQFPPGGSAQDPLPQLDDPDSSSGQLAAEPAGSPNAQPMPDAISAQDTHPTLPAARSAQPLPSDPALSEIEPTAEPANRGQFAATSVASEGRAPLAEADTSRAPGKPGPAELEGPQSPSLTIEKVAPREIRVGTTAKFLLKVRNVGQVAANRVVVQDEVPHGTRLLSTVPQADRRSDGTILWQMGTIQPGDEVTAFMELAPLEEGQIGSVATVSFQASASARATATKPRLELEQVAPRHALIGQDVVFSIRLSNPGTGSAQNVVLVENVPEGLKHSAGSELEFAVGTLKPGESRQLELTLKANRPGKVENVLVARADANLTIRDNVQLEVIAPQLQVELSGPNRRYLQRPATYTISLKNPGTAPAQDIQLVAHLPRGVKFANTNNAGYYDAPSHAVHWNLQELPAGEMGTVRLTVQPTEMGQHKLRAEATAQMGLTAATEKPLLVEGLAALLFTVGDVTDPIEVGGQTTYEIRVVNQGSKAATNLRLAATVPAGLRAIGGDGPTQVTVQPEQVIFEPLARLNPQANVTYKIHVQGEQAGDKRFRVQLTADEMSQPVIKEESTRVYAD